MCRGIQKSLAIDTRLFPMALKCIQVEYECCLDDHRFCQINVGKRRVDLLRKYLVRLLGIVPTFLMVLVSNLRQLFVETRIN